jgi:Transposase DNA-binding/Transposase Tn5 dimerisation domain
MNTSKEKAVCGEGLARWCEEEFSGVDFGDKRLNRRLVLLSKRLSERPLAPINQACGEKMEAKAAYRFFGNEKTRADIIQSIHHQQVVERMDKEDLVFLVQDTTFLNYTMHPQTEGLGKIGRYLWGQNKGRGLVMHTSFALGKEGLPLGVLDQQIWARAKKPKAERIKKLTRIPIEKKESYKWIKSLRQSLEGVSAAQRSKVVTVADREADIFEFLEEVIVQQTHFLVRAHDAMDRVIIKEGEQVRNRSGTAVNTLLKEIKQSPVQGEMKVEVLRRAAGAVEAEIPAREARVEVHFCPVKLALPRRQSIRHRSKIKINHEESRRQSLARALSINAIWVKEINSPSKTQSLEWLLLTDLPVETFEQAKEKIKFYQLRWRIESFHKILKSGCRVEDCRLESAERLKKYLTLCSIISWRILWMTLLNRQSPKAVCTEILTEAEWKSLYCRIHKTRTSLSAPPTVHEAMRWIAQLGGFLARKCDGEPGMTTIWRGWQRLSDIAEDWEIFNVH